MFRVLDNAKPARFPEHHVDPSWSNCDFATFVEALNYAHKWLGPYSKGRILKLNENYDYSGYGDELCITRLD